MKNIKNIYLLACSAVLFTFHSCGDEYVNVASPDVNSEEYFNTEEEYQSALVGAYDLLQSTYINVMLGEIASDNTLAGGESATDVPGIQDIDDMKHSPINAQLSDIWGLDVFGCKPCKLFVRISRQNRFYW